MLKLLYTMYIKNFFFDMRNETSEIGENFFKHQR